MTLRLVGSEPPKPKRRKWQKPPPVLSTEEETRFRATLRGLRDAFGGTWGALSAAMHAREESVRRVVREGRHVSGDLIIRAMRASGLTFDELLGNPALVGTCRSCGQVKRRTQ